MSAQHYELNRISIDQFCELTNSKIKKSTPGKCRDVLDAMRTVAWYYGVEKAVGKFRPHQLELLLEPESFSENNCGEKIRRNKWRQYKIGRHTPSEEFILKISKRSKPHTTKIFHHVLWDVLKEENLVADHWSNWIQRIPKNLFFTAPS